MAKSKKTKIHKKIDGQILQMNKQFSNLKMKQKDKITEWVYEEYKKYVTEHDKVCLLYTSLVSGAEGACLFWHMDLLYAALQRQGTDWIKQFSIR